MGQHDQYRLFIQRGMPEALTWDEQYQWLVTHFREVDEKADRIRQLEAERVEWMALVWPLEEWLGDRIAVEKLRESVAPLIEKLGVKQ